MPNNVFDSKEDEDTVSKKRRTCRAGAGIEATYVHCDTDGFQERTDPEIVYDHRKFFRIDLLRNNKDFCSHLATSSVPTEQMGM